MRGTECVRRARSGLRGEGRGNAPSYPAILWFSYVVQSGDTDADGISIAADALTLNGGSIRSAGGTDAELDLGGHAIVNAADHKVDGGG